MFDWERSLRSSGISFVLFVIVAYVLYGSQPKVGASAGELVSYYHGNSTRISIATVVMGFAVLGLLWFAAALSTVIRDSGQGTWAAAATAASAGLGVVLFVLMTLRAALAYSIAGSANSQITSALNDSSWALMVVSSFPAAMLVMAGSFGLWKAEIISTALFGPGAVAIVLVLLDATTWAGDGIWAPDGAYSQFISPIIFLLWVAVASGLLYRLSPSTASTRRPDRAAVSVP